MSQNKVAIVGGGLGGLSAAISLRSAGYDVHVFEKNAHLGGKLNVKEAEGFTFDLGPSIFTLPQHFESLFARAGRKMSDYVKIERVQPHWRNFFDDGSHIDLTDDMDIQRAELEKLVGGSAKNWPELEGFLAYCREQYVILDEGYLRKGLDGLWEFLKHYGLFKTGKAIDWNRTMAETIAEHFSDEKMRRIFEYFIKYVGSSALNAPGYMNLMPIIQYDYGLWYVSGGMYELAKGLEKLMREMGIEISKGADVAEITKAGKTVTGVRLEDGTTHKAEIVVSNMEVIPTYAHLLGESDRFLKKLEKFEPACSGIVLHLGLNKEFPQLAHHNFFFSGDQHKHFRTVFDKHEIPEDPTLYVVAPTRTDPTKAPAGMDNIKILPHIPYLRDDRPVTHEDYVALKDRCINKMERLGCEGLRDAIVYEDLLTPVDIQEMYRSNGGSIYGVVSDWKKNYSFKAPKTSSKYRNLYFCGGSVNPGGGMPMVVLSGQKAADRIIAKHGDRSRSVA